MRQGHKVLIAVVLSAVVTFLFTAYFIKQGSARGIADLVIKTSIEMESFNDVGRVEAYDFLEDLIRKGCNKEALEFINHQQSSLLSGLRYRMKDYEPVREKVMERNREVGERAIREVSRQGAFVYPSCKRPLAQL